MNGEVARRVAGVGLAYLVGAVLVVGVVDWVRPVLALPALFSRLVRVALAAGFVIALLLAWQYPRLGHHGATPVGPEQGPPES